MVEPIKYVCKKACFYRGRLWAPGEILEPRDGATGNKHFRLIGGPVEPEKSPEPVAKPVEPKTLAAYQEVEDKAMREAATTYETRARKNSERRKKGVINGQ